MDKGFSAVLTIDLDDKLGGEAKQVRLAINTKHKILLTL